MEIATVRNAIIDALEEDADLSAFLTATTKVDYGLGKNVVKAMLPKCVRVVQLGRGSTFDDAEEEAEYGGGYVWVWAKFRFHVVGIVAPESTDTEKTIEDAVSTMDRLIRKALGQDWDLDGIVTDMELGRTLFRVHPDDNVRFVIVEVEATAHERTDTR